MSLRPLGDADPLERPQRGLAVAVPRPPPPGEAGEGAHQGDVERGDGEVEPGALGLGDRGCPPADLDRPPHRPELAEQDAQQGRLPAAVRAEQRDALAGLDLEGDVPRSPGRVRSRRQGRVGRARTIVSFGMPQVAGRVDVPSSTR